MMRYKARPLPSLDLVRERFDYNPATGEFIHKQGQRKGHRADLIVQGRYRAFRICMDGATYEHSAHRTAWALINGRDPGPDFVVHHINGDIQDNRASNLALASQSQNIYVAAHRKGKWPRGVRQYGERFSARIKVKGRVIHLGMFASAAEASAAYGEAARHYFGDAWIVS